MHQLGVNFVERVHDVLRRHTDDGKAPAPGESLEFLTQIRGWQSEERRRPRNKETKDGGIKYGQS
jgi:hypothetical protein